MLGWPEAERDAFLDGQFRAQLASYRARFPGSDHTLICLGGRPVGRLWVARTADELLVVDLALLPASRGSGIGTTLLRGLLDEAQAASVPVRLSVERDNPRAMALYRQLGFRPVGGDELRVRMECRSPASPAASR
jgi:ribosomal protein S18 acetylase RimI-like enzyme